MLTIPLGYVIIVISKGKAPYPTKAMKLTTAQQIKKSNRIKSIVKTMDDTQALCAIHDTCEAMGFLEDFVVEIRWGIIHRLSTLDPDTCNQWLEGDIESSPTDYFV